VLVELQDHLDPESGDRYTVKRYESEKASEGDAWRHSRIILHPINPEFDPIIIEGDDDAPVRVIAKVIRVLGTGNVDQ